MTAVSANYGRHRRAGAARRVALRAVLGGAATAALGAWSSGRVLHATTPATPESALVLGATALLAGASLWLTVLMLLSALSTLPGGAGTLAHEALRALAPHSVGALLTVALGAGVSAGHLAEFMPGAHASAPTGVVATQDRAERDAFADGALAMTGHGSLEGLFGRSAAEPQGTTLDALSPGWTPDAPPAAPTLPQADLRLLGGGHAATGEVTVRAGDSLWDIVARHHGARATPALVAADLPRWHEANRTTIGDSMDRLLPGQVLTPPPAAQ